jgi:hypothetical protein
MVIPRSSFRLEARVIVMTLEPLTSKGSGNQAPTGLLCAKCKVDIYCSRECQVCELSRNFRPFHNPEQWLHPGSAGVYMLFVHVARYGCSREPRRLLSVDPEFASSVRWLHGAAGTRKIVRLLKASKRLFHPPSFPPPSVHRGSGRQVWLQAWRYQKERNTEGATRNVLFSNVLRTSREFSEH